MSICLTQAMTVPLLKPLITSRALNRVYPSASRFLLKTHLQSMMFALFCGISDLSINLQALFSLIELSFSFPACSQFSIRLICIASEYIIGSLFILSMEHCAPSDCLNSLVRLVSWIGLLEYTFPFCASASIFLLLLVSGAESFSGFHLCFLSVSLGISVVVIRYFLQLHLGSSSWCPLDHHLSSPCLASNWLL